MFRKRHPPAGSKPGTLVMHARAQRPVIRVMKYKPDHLEEHDIAAVARLGDLLEANTVCWIDVQGLGDEGMLREVADLFSIHPLALEDVVNVPQRPKTERFEEHTLCITRMVQVRNELIEPEQVIGHGRDAALWLLAPSNWVDVVRSAGGTARAGPGPSLAGLVVLFVLWLAAPRLMRLVREAGDAVSRPSRDSMARTIGALLATAALAGDVLAGCLDHQVAVRRD